MRLSPWWRKLQKLTTSAAYAAARTRQFGRGIILGTHCRQSMGGGTPDPHSGLASVQGPHFSQGGSFPAEGASAAAAGVAQRLTPEPGDRIPPGAQLCAGGHPQVSL